MNEIPDFSISRPSFTAIAGIEPMELASLAAAMASTTEAPTVTARRAMELFEACKNEVFKTAANRHESQNFKRESDCVLDERAPPSHRQRLSETTTISVKDLIRKT